MDERGLIGWELYLKLLYIYIGKKTDWKEADIDEMNKLRI